MKDTVPASLCLLFLIHFSLKRILCREAVFTVLAYSMHKTEPEEGIAKTNARLKDSASLSPPNPDGVVVLCVVVIIFSYVS